VPRSLTPEFISHLLAQADQAEHAVDYQRLMEIYCVVKTGGTAAQLAAAQNLQTTEQAALEAEITQLLPQANSANQVAALRQEIQEVQRSVAHRVAYLQSIDPQEERTVQDCLSMIDAHFAQVNDPHPQ
jgi:hypothetical protein